MRWRDFAFLADENIHAEVVDFLRDQGFSIAGVESLGLRGASDLDVLRLAHAQTRVVITHDRDFGNLAIASAEPMTGILFLRPGHIRPAYTIESLRAVLARDLDLEPPFIVVAERTGDQVRIRVRHL